MSQIAQQDHLYINVDDLALDEPALIASYFWNELEEKAKAGTLCDVILINFRGNFAKIFSAEFDDEDNLVNASYAFSGDVYSIVKQ